MNTYEYKTIRNTWTLPECKDDGADSLIQEYLNNVGKDGWELINYDLVIEYLGTREITTRISIFGIAKKCKKSIGYQIDEICPAN